MNAFKNLPKKVCTCFRKAEVKTLYLKKSQDKHVLGARELTELLKIVVFTLLWYHPPPCIPPRLSVGTRGWWTYPGSTFCYNNTSAMEKKYVSRYHLVSWKMGCACVFATSNILVMYVLVSKHSRSVNVKSKFICLMEGFGGVGIPNIRALSRPCRLMLCRCVSSIVSRGRRLKESLIIFVNRDCAVSQS
jgi:hypothetical protein